MTRTVLLKMRQQEFREREVRETQLLLGTSVRSWLKLGKQENYTLILEGNENATVVLHFTKTIDLTPKMVHATIKLRRQSAKLRDVACR